MIYFWYEPGLGWTFSDQDPDDFCLRDGPYKTYAELLSAYIALEKEERGEL